VAVEAPNVAELRRIARDLAPSIEMLTVPAYVLDRNGVVRWLNAAAVEHFGDLRGKRIGQIVVHEDVGRAREAFASKLLGMTKSTEATVAVRTADGRRVLVDISSTQLRDEGSIVGVFGLADPSGEPPPGRADQVHLTPRQLEVLRYLAAGHGTHHIAKTLGISTETVRNHVRGLLGRLEAHTRLAAVIKGHELGLV
jgi:PAS domain S-box-containing protein